MVSPGDELAAGPVFTQGNATVIGATKKRMTIPRWRLSLTHTPTHSLDEHDWHELLAFFRASYEIDSATVRRRVMTKTHLFRVRERANGRLVATTSTGVMKIPMPGGGSARVFFGGDSLIVPELRGSGIMQEFAIRTVLRDLREDPWAERYGFGVALTHLMYRALVRSFQDVWPRPGGEMKPEQRHIMDVLGRHMYQEHWHGPERPIEADRIGREPALVMSDESLSDPIVRFFMDRNPSYPRTALPVLMKLDARNLASVLRRLVRKRR